MINYLNEQTSLQNSFKPAVRILNHTKNHFVKYFFLVVLLFVIVQPISVHANKNPENKIYKSTTAAGQYQKIGTLAPLSIHQNTEQIKEAVIFVHGLNGVKLSESLYEWLPFINHWKNSKSIPNKDKYGLYIFRYEGWNSVFDSADLLSKGINELLAEQKSIEKLTLVGYSQGGLVNRIILDKHPDLESKARKVVYIATTHHGTPTLTRSITMDYLVRQPALIKAKNIKILQTLMNWYKYGYLEQAWDNFDSMMPPSSNYQVPKEVLSLPEIIHPEKQIAYASYFFPNKVTDFESGFSVFFGETIPRNFLDRRASMKELNRWISRKIYTDEDPKLRQNFGLNDGVAPVSSSLWVKLCSAQEQQPASWKVLFKENNYCPRVGVSRAFYGVDHLMWRQETSGSKILKDELHPEDKAKAAYDWILEDAFGARF